MSGLFTVKIEIRFLSWKPKSFLKLSVSSLPVDMYLCRHVHVGKCSYVCMYLLCVYVGK